MSITMLPAYAERRRYSEETLANLRDALADTLGGAPFLIGTNGSFARREASAFSDLDFFVVCRDGSEVPDVAHRLEAIRPALARIVEKPPAIGGAFNQIEPLPRMLSNIGGQEDANDKITRRMLLLLEGEWLFNEPLFHEVREKVLRRYIRDGMPPQKIVRFLLNDIIRYYRTIAVDFEHKTQEASKAWGTRYIKLVFARKLLYASGVFATAETCDLSVADKIATLRRLLTLPVVERILAVCGDAALPALLTYDGFLREFAKGEVRRALERTTEATRDSSAVFNDLKDQGQELTAQLVALLRRRYPESHPIHLALFA